MSTTAQLQASVDRLWAAQDVAQAAGVTVMTVHLWRARGLPAVVLPGLARPAVRFVPADVADWCRAHGYRLRAHDRLARAA